MLNNLCEYILLFCCRYLGSGCDQIDLHLTYRLGHTTIGKILRKVCMAIWECLLPESFPEFTEERWKTVADGFQQYCQFPNCLGAIDGKHVRLRKPKMSGSLFYNYKHFFSIVLLAIADSNYNFIYIDVGDFGKESDSTIFQRSSFNRKLEENTLNIPRPQPLPGTATRMPYTFIGDEAFSLSPNIMRPFSGKVLSEKKRIFNYRLSRARRNVESTFGILSNKWKIFQKPINVNLDLAILLIKTCCSLHNFVRVRDGINIHEALSVEGIIDIVQRNHTQRGPNQAIQARNELADYFVSEVGSVPWQNKYI